MEPAINIFKEKEEWANYFGALLRVAGHKEAGDYLIESHSRIDTSKVDEKISGIVKKDFKPTLAEDMGMAREGAENIWDLTSIDGRPL